MSKTQSLVSSNPLFASLDELTLRAVLDAGLSRKYPKGSLIALADELWPYLFLVIEGRVSAIKDQRDQRIERGAQPADLNV
ncbi:MAG: hypothetical protein QME21_09165 [Anaerolineales bacterium]|nr:hypothetical protein [Anaerolineales bacterium]